MDSKDNKTTGTLARGIKIIDIIRNIGRPCSSAEIAQICEFDASTTHRMLQLLHEHGYIIRDDASKRYFASPKLLFPLSIYSPLNELRREAARAANQFRDEYEQTTGFVLFCMKERILIEIATGQNSLSPAYDTWLNSPIHASASGKVLLLTMSAAERSELLGSGPFEEHTQYTITDPGVLERDLEICAEKGYVVARDDFFSGLTAIGAPIWTEEGACIGCTFMNGRSANIPEEQLEQLGLALKAMTDLFSLGTPAIQAVGSMFGAKTSNNIPRMKSRWPAHSRDT